MLLNIDPVLSPDLLFALHSMGHGDEIALVDANYPANSSKSTCIRADGVDCDVILKAVLSVMPLDTYVAHPVLCMQVVDNANVVPDIVTGFESHINAVSEQPVNIKSLERFAFYERVSQAYAVVQTGERRLYGNIILKKGVIG